MNSTARQGSPTALATGVWSLWIDGVGGYRILEGNRFSIGGPGDASLADIAVRFAWRRHVATLQKIGGDFWLRPCDGDDRGEPIPRSISGAVVSLARLGGTATGSWPTLRFRAPSPLSDSVVLQIDPPHRFVAPVDAFVLFDKSILIGPEVTNHIRIAGLTEPVVMTKQADEWTLRRVTQPPQTLRLGEAVRIDDVGLAIRREEASVLGEMR